MSFTNVTNAGRFTVLITVIMMRIGRKALEKVTGMYHLVGVGVVDTFIGGLKRMVKNDYLSIWI